MAKNEKTSKEMATLAGKVLSDPKATPREKKLAACVLTQVEDKPKPKKSVQKARKK